MARAAAAFVVRGFANRIGRQAIAGVWDSFGMMRRFSRSASDKSIYRLRPEVRSYISATDMKNESLFTRVRRQFMPLPRD